MPIAGNKSADRARAHLRWAERYSKYGDVHKATSHFGRAMEYSGFGTVHTSAIQGADGSSRNLRIEVTVGSENTIVHVSDWSGNEDATRFTNDVMLTIAEPSEYYDVDIETQDIEQLQKHLNRTGYTEWRVVFVDDMSVSHKDNSADVPLELTYAALSFLLNKGHISRDSVVVIYKNGFRRRATTYPYKLAEVRHFKPLGKSLLIARARDLPLMKMNVGKQKQTTKPRSKSPSKRR